MRSRRLNKAIAIVLTLIMTVSLGLNGLTGINYANAVSGTEMLQNGDFENGINNWEDWENTAVETAEVHEGSGAIKIGTGAAEAEGGRGQIIDGISEGKTYVVSGWGKVSVTTDAAIIGVDCLGSDGKKIKGAKFSITFDTSKYEEKSLKFTTVEGTVGLQVYVYKNGGPGYAYLDDISLTEEPAVEIDPNLVKNSDFEITEATSSSAISGWDRNLDIDDGVVGKPVQTMIDIGSGCEGTNSIRIGMLEGGRGQIIDNISEKTVFTLSGWGKVSAAGETGYFGVDCLDSNGKKLSGGKFGFEYRTTEFTNQTRTFTTVPGTAKLQVYVYKGSGTAYAYFDKISLVQTGESPIPEAKLLQNGDFETYNEAAPADLSGWENWGATINTVNEGCNGTHAAKIGTGYVDEKINGEGGAGQRVENILEGATYTVSGWGKTTIQGTDNEAIIGVDCFDSTNKKIVGGKFAITFPETEYSEKSLTFTTVPGTKAISVYIYKNPGAGYAYIDNISITKSAPVEPKDTVINPTKPSSDVFFDDFTNGIDPDKWLIGKAQWGVGNGGVIPENVVVNNGIVEITGNGDNYTGPIKGINKDLSLKSDGKRTGGVIVTKDFYASGSYEVRAKILPKLGACSAFWTFFNDGTKNHEIDIEVPAEKTVNKLMTTNWVTETDVTSVTTDTPTALGTEKGITDGEWHNYRFDWHTDTANPKVDYYIDDKLVCTNTTNIPFAAGRFWSGVWFPNNWAGVPDFDTDKMYIDWIKITPYSESGDQWLANNDSTWADLTEYPPMTNTSTAKAHNTNNFTYMSISEMNEKRALTDKSITDFVNQLNEYGIKYQFCDMETFTSEGKITVSDTGSVSELTKHWIKVSRELYPNTKIIGTINGNLAAHVTSSEAIRQSIADECKKLVAADDVYNFDGIQVDMEPFRAEGNKDLIDLLKKIRAAIGADKHLSIATTAGAKYLPDSDITAIADIVDMINPMLYDSCGTSDGEVKTSEEYIKFWKESVLRYSNAIAKSSNTDCQLSPTMPVYQQKGDGGLIYHVSAIENIPNAAKGLIQAIKEGAKVYNSGIFWWGCFTNAQYDNRDGQDYAKDRKWWLEDWVNVKLDSTDPVVTTGSAISTGGGNSVVTVKDTVITKEGNVPKAQLESVIDKATGKAVSTVDATLIEKLNKQSEKNEAGIKEFTLEVQKAEGAKFYSVKFEGVSLNAKKVEKSIEIRTQIANLTITDSMLSNIKDTAKNIEFNVANADKSKIIEQTRNIIGDRPVIELSMTLDGKAFNWSNPDAAVKIAVKYTPTADELKNPEHITVWYIGDDGKVIPVTSARYDAKTGMVTFNVTHFSKYAIVNVNKTFDDIANVSWAKKQIEVLASKGIINGTSQGSFSPKVAVTRAEFVDFLVKALGITASFEDNFSDVKADSACYETLGIARKLGIIEGTGDNCFSLENEITRQDMMVILFKTLNITNKQLSTGIDNDVKKYADKSDVSAYAIESVQALVKSGIIQGDGTYLMPKSNLTRAETAALLYNIYNTYSK